MALAEHIAALPRDPALARRSPEERIAFEALSAFRLLDVDVVCAPEGDARPALRDLCTGLVANMQRLSDALSGSYLAPATISRSLASPGPSHDLSATTSPGTSSPRPAKRGEGRGEGSAT